MKIYDLYCKVIGKELLYPALWYSEDEGEAWDLGDYIGVLQKDSDFIAPYQIISLAEERPIPVVIESMKDRRKSRNEPEIAPSFRCRWAFVVWSKDTSEGRGDAAYLPVKVCALIQENLLKNKNPYQEPLWSPTVVVDYDDKGNKKIDSVQLREDLERQFVSNYMLLRHKAVEAIAKRPIVEPKKIGTMSDGMKALYGVDSFWDMVKQNDERPRNKTGCLIPLLVLLASATAACAMACCNAF